MGILRQGGAADVCRRHQSEAVMDIKRALVNAKELWYPFLQQLHRFMIAISRVSVNHDGSGGTAPDPLVMDQGSRAKQHKVDVGVTVDLATLPGPLGFLDMPWVQVDCGTGADVAESAVRVCLLSGYASLASWCCGPWAPWSLQFRGLFEQWAGHWLLVHMNVHTAQFLPLRTCFART